MRSLCRVGVGMCVYTFCLCLNITTDFHRIWRRNYFNGGHSKLVLSNPLKSVTTWQTHEIVRWQDTSAS